jgi:peptide/nickel transport system substrate-binding protein
MNVEDLSKSFWKSRVSRRRLVRGAAAGGAGLAIASLAACATRPSGGGQTGSSGAASATPKTGGKFSVQIATDPFDWDTTIAGKSAPNGGGDAIAYDTLLNFNQGPNVPYEHFDIVPSLASKYEQPDPTTYTFHLRQGVKFAPLAPVNGRELTSADVKWSYEYSSRTGQFANSKLPASNFNWLFEGMDSIETPDPYTVTVKFKQPFVPFLTYVAFDYNGIFPHEIVDQYGDMKDHIVGSGPWQVDESSSQKGSKWVWKRNPNYWDSGKPYIDEVDWLVISDIASVTSAFTTNQLDMIPALVLDSNQTAVLKKQAPSATAYGFVKPASEFYFYQKTGPLADARVRQAIGLALDRDEIIKTIDAGDGLWGMSGSFNSTFTQEEIKQILKYDPQQAKQLVSAAGYGNGLDLELVYPGHDYGDAYIAKIQLVQSQLKKAGINLNLKSTDKNDFNSAKRVGKFEVVLADKGSLVGDVDSFLYAGFYSTSTSNYGRVNDPQLDALLTQQRQELDATKRQDIVRQAVKLIATQGYSYATDAARTYIFWNQALQNYAPQYGVDRVPLAQSWVNRS